MVFLNKGENKNACARDVHESEPAGSSVRNGALKNPKPGVAIRRTEPHANISVALLNHTRSMKGQKLEYRFARPETSALTANPENYIETKDFPLLRKRDHRNDDDGVQVCWNTDTPQHACIAFACKLSAQP